MNMLTHKDRHIVSPNDPAQIYSDRQAVAQFLSEHDRLTTWDGLSASVSQLFGFKKKLVFSTKDAYGELASYLHRIALDQQQPGNRRDTHLG